MREVVARRRLAHPAARADQAAVGEGHLEAEDVLADRAVAHGRGAGGARPAHAADGAVAAGIDGEEQALVAEMVVERVPGDAGLDAAVHVALVHLDDARHAGEVERDAAADGGNVPLEARARPVRHDWNAVLVAEAEQGRRLLRPLDEGDRVRQHPGVAVLAVAVLIEQARVGRDALAE